MIKIMGKVKILDFEVDKTNKAEVLNKIRVYLGKKQKFSVVTLNPEILVEASRNKILAGVIRDADIAVPDGVGLKLADFSLTIIKGRELMLDLVELARISNLKIYLLGSTEIVNTKCQRVLSEMFPGLKVKGRAGPKLDANAQPLTEKDVVKEKEAVAEINRYKPELVFVAFGAPKQELWISRWLGELQVLGMMSIGGTLDFLTSAQKPPKIMSNWGFEWLWRLYHEPKRWSRIITAVVIFPLKLLVYPHTLRSVGIK